MTTVALPLLCARCLHPSDWHRLDDARNLDPTDPATPFRCLGYDPSVDGPLSACDCPDLVIEPKPPAAGLSDWMLALALNSGRPRDATQAEKNIARAWVERHRFTNPRDADVEYDHALAILVFGNARPPLKRGRLPR